jgi:hypothetical protein
MNALQNLFSSAAPTPSSNDTTNLSRCRDSLQTLNQTMVNQHANIEKLQAQNNLLQSQIPNIKETQTKLEHGFQDEQTIMNETITFPFFMISLALLILVMFFTSVYNGVLTHQVMLVVKESGVLEALVKGLKTGQLAVDTDGKMQTIDYFWDSTLTDMSRIISRGRFIMFVTMYFALMAFIILLYSLYYRGVNIYFAGKAASIFLLLILGVTFLFVNNITITKPFESVVGYLWVTMFNGKALDTCLSGIFQHKYFKEKEVFPGARVYYTQLLNTMDVNNYPAVIEEIYKNNFKYDFNINTTETSGITNEKVNKLFELVLKKNTVGHVCWVYFASLASVFISMKYLFSIGI